MNSCLSCFKLILIYRLAKVYCLRETEKKHIVINVAYCSSFFLYTSSIKTNYYC